MSYYSLGDSFHWFIARVIDIKDPMFLGRVKIRIIHQQTGELGKKVKTFGILDDDLLWAYPLSAIQSASLSWKKINELEQFDVPDWIDAVGLSPTGIAVGSYAYGFYLDGHESNIPLIFGTYHKLSLFPEPPTDPQTGEMLQMKAPEGDTFDYYDVGSLAKGFIYDPVAEESRPGQTLPKEPYAISSLWKNDPKAHAPVDEFPTAYATEYPYNTTYTTKSGHAIELDDTPGHERIHIWHKSGCYEEISNGPSPFLDDDESKEWPKDGPEGYSYITAGGVAEDDYTGRRSRKTMDSFFDVVMKDKNELTLRDHNVEIANTQTIKIGKSQHITVGIPAVTGNRINDNEQSTYENGGLDKFNVYFDVANNTTQTTGNNFSIQVGYGADSEQRFSKEDKFNAFFRVANNAFVEIGNNQIITIANNQTVSCGNNCTVSVGNNSSVSIAENCTVTVGKNCTITVSGDASISVSGTLDMSSSGAMNISSGTSITMNAPSIDIN